MEVFNIDPETYDQGKTIQGIDSVTWVERYREAGEFTITGEPTWDLRTNLFIGAMISHSNSVEVMMVENHEIDETKDGPPVLIVTGRSIDAVAMENRTLNPGWYYGYKDTVTNDAIGASLVSNPVWDQIEYLIATYLILNPITDENYPNLAVINTLTGDTDPNETNRFIPIGPLYPIIQDLLKSFDGGIRVARPQYATAPNMRFVIHKGNDKRDTVQFNYLRGDVENARYLWSGKNVRNKAYVRSEYYGVVVDPATIFGSPLHGWGLRVEHVDFSQLSDLYTGGDPTVEAAIANMLFATGWIALKASLENAFIVDATISPTAQFQYRSHYDIGDIVNVQGNYGIQSPMRVSEYAVTWDKTGTSGIPTLSALST